MKFPDSIKIGIRHFPVTDQNEGCRIEWVGARSIWNGGGFQSRKAEALQPPLSIYNGLVWALFS